MSRMALSSTLRNSARESVPFWCCSLASSNTLGRRKLPTWSARKGGFFASVMRDPCGLLDALEALHALSGIDVARVDVAVRIDGHGVDPVKFAGGAALAAERANLLACFSQQD